MAAEVWYRDYEALRQQVLALRESFRARCKTLEVEPNRVEAEVRRELIARAVHESNWQEGIELDSGKTQELANYAFDDLEDVEGPHLDMNRILKFHRDVTIKLKRRGASREELAAYNLAKAHAAIDLVAVELIRRQNASLIYALKGFQPYLRQIKDKAPQAAAESIERGFEVISEIEGDESPVPVPMTGQVGSFGELSKKLTALPFDSLLHPMRTAYIHFFHKVVLMGIIPINRCGCFRKTPVHVGNPNVYFPVPSAVPKLMSEFCNRFPTILPSNAKFDPIIESARVSHRFVCIHPYADGNGRVSRVLMNMVLWGHFPPVYLKADRKGRHRYGYALGRADRDDIAPLASLIAMSLIEIYERILGTLRLR